jgi:large subunit ribosomal protein L25
MEIESIKREDTGRGGSRRLRRQGYVPAILYGDGQALAIACEARKIRAGLGEESFRSSILTLVIGEEKFSALLREVQMHPHRAEAIHLDFQIVHENVEISTSVPLHFINIDTAPGVKLYGGLFTTIENQVAIHCLPKDIPEFISVDVGELNIGGSVHLSDIEPPAGVRFDAITRGEDPALAILSELRKGEEEETTATESPDEEATAASTDTPSA